MIYDEFRLFGPQGETIALGLTYRLYDHAKQRWDMRYVGAISPGPDGRTPQQTANWAELSAWRDGSTIRVDQRGAGSQLRITYYDISADHFSWKADVSTDGGKTWNQDQIRIEAARRRVVGAATEELRWPVGAASIVGTLHLPHGSGPFPAVVFAPGRDRLEGTT